MGNIPGVVGPREDPHFIPTCRYESHGMHFRVNPEEAAERGWYYRPEWYMSLIPDTRKCRFCGEEVFSDWPGMTDEDKAIRNPTSPNVMAGPTFQWP